MANTDLTIETKDPPFLALVRVNGVFAYYLNGERLTEPTEWHREQEASCRSIQGTISDVEFAPQAKYIENFTDPTAPFPGE